MKFFTPRRFDTIFAGVFIIFASGSWQLGIAAYFAICAVQPRDEP